MGLFTSSREGGDDDIFLVSFNPEATNMNQTILTSVSTKEEKIVSLNKVVETTPINQPTLEEKMAEQKESQPTTSEEEKIVSLNKVVETTPINQPTVDEKMAEQKESQSTTSEEEKITPLTKVVETTPINQPTVDEKMAEQKENQSTTSKEEKIIPPARVAVTRPINQPTLAEKNRAQQENQPVINKEEKEVIIERKVFLEQFDVEGTKVEKNKIYTVPNIQFFEGEYFVTYKIAKELDLIAALLKKHQTLKIEIASHTANLSSFEEKISLTQKRADAILDYLGRKGIDASSVQGKGYGGQQPLNNCLMDIDCSVEEHTINDRVEVKVIEK